MKVNEVVAGTSGFHRVEVTGFNNLYPILVEMIGREIAQQAAENILTRLMEERIISLREFRIMKAAISREVLSFELQVRDQLRATILRAMIAQIFINIGGESS